MSALHTQRRFVVAPEGLSVHQAHVAVRQAKGIRRRHTHRRGHSAQWARHLRASHDRAAADGTTAQPGNPLQEAGLYLNHRTVPTILTIACAVGLLFLGAVSLFTSATSARVLLLGVTLIAVGGAVCLNATTINPVTAQQPRRDTPSH